MNPGDNNNKKFEVKTNRLNLNNEPRNENLEQTNIVFMHESNPIDLNMMSFINNCNIPDQVDTSQDLKIMEKVNTEHSKFKGLILNRYNQLKMLKSYWETSINSAISGLAMMKDRAVTHDFFTFILEKDLRESNISFTLENLIDLFPLIDTLISSKYESHKRNGLKAAKSFLAFFQERLISGSKMKETDSVNVSVDLESRKKKCDAVINLYKSLHSNQYILSMSNSKSNPEIKKFASEFLMEIENFFLKVM